MEMARRLQPNLGIRTYVRQNLARRGDDFSEATLVCSEMLDAKE